MRNESFQPTRITVSAGTTVTWDNEDSEPHTVTADDNSTFDSGALTPGESFQHTFSQPGQYAYHCDFHPNMTATIIVQ